MPDVVAAVRMDMNDQEAFARLSGDRNPIHMDPMAARQTQAGGPVVHGMHLLLWALERLAERGVDLAPLRAGKAKFASFIPVGAAVTLSAAIDQSGRLRLDIASDSEVAVTGRLDFTGVPRRRAGRQYQPVIISDEAYDPQFDRLAGSSGRLKRSGHALAQAEAMFPELCGSLGAAAVCDMALMSTVVGMVAPGLNSILSEVAFSALEGVGSEPGLAFAVVHTDPRFRLVINELEGERFGGRATAFARLAAPTPLSIRDALGMVSIGEFRDRRALVVGGSRGLGAATSVLLAAGGANVTLTYHRERDQAELVASNIRDTVGRNSCDVIRYDASGAAALQLSSVAPGVTHAYYFATPRIFAGPRQSYSRQRLDHFISVYVDGFIDLVTALLTAQSPRPLSVLYPSSVAVIERPRHMTEYAMAKAAGEIAAADLAKACSRLTIASPRLPRVATKQTATVPPVPAADPSTVMLQLLRQQAGQKARAEDPADLRPLAFGAVGPFRSCSEQRRAK